MMSQSGRKDAILGFMSRCHPRKTTVKIVADYLRSIGIEVTDKTVIRDLEEFADQHIVLRDDRGKPHGWTIKDGYDLIRKLAARHDTALPLLLADRYLRDLLPEEVVIELSATVQILQHHLRDQDSCYSHWLGKVATISGGLSRLSPRINGGIRETLTNALLKNEPVRVIYRRQDNEVRERVLWPKALVMRDGVPVIVAQEPGGYPKQYLLYRFEKAIAIASTVSVTATTGFELENYLNESFKYFLSSQPFLLRLRIEPELEKELLERPLSGDQRIQYDRRRNFLMLYATVVDSYPLRSWLLSQGDNVEVKGPVVLRNLLTTIVANMAEDYGLIPSDSAVDKLVAPEE
ncbi:helix-turn-helix transcriptional regulator [Acidithiobacillus ferrivorans]|nr:WYL domain-containing protein [Acidithiobacillus ferrivorans]